jgi:uncharacterized protein with GYD domain
MQRYVVLLNWTDQGVRGVKDTAKRAEAARSQAEKLGGKLQVYYTLGEYDLVGILEMPDDDTVMQFVLWVGSLGNIRTKTMRAWTEAEAARVVAKL